MPRQYTLLVMLSVNAERRDVGRSRRGKRQGCTVADARTSALKAKVTLGIK